MNSFRNVGISILDLNSPMTKGMARHSQLRSTGVAIIRQQRVCTARKYPVSLLIQSTVKRVFGITAFPSL